MPDSARLVQPRADRVQADDEQRLGGVDRLGRLPVALELGKGLREPRQRRVRGVVGSPGREKPPLRRRRSRALPGGSLADQAELYTQIVVDEPTEIFDDLYLGLRAGGALRKKRRGEPLTSEEQEALGRWQRLGRARKIVALGAFTLGTFGLGFTIGGLIFGRWRRA